MTTFAYRGPLAPDSALFRGREAEMATLTRLCQGEVRAYAIVYGGRQTGKTSLLLRLAATLPESTRACRVDFQRLPRATAPQVYAYLAECVAEGLSCAAPPSAALRTAPDLTRFLCRALGESRVSRLALLLEELGALRQAAQEDLANLLRSIFTSRFDPSCHSLSRLMVVLAGGIELYGLAATQVSTLYSICEALYLPDLTETEAVALVADGLTASGLSRPQAETLGQTIYTHAAGHPYLTQRLGGMVEESLAAGAAPTPSGVTAAVERLLSGDPLLTHLRKAIDEQQLSGAVEALLGERVRFSRLDEEMACLELLGLARESGGCWSVRNTLLERALKEWRLDTTYGARQEDTSGVAQSTAQIVVQGDLIVGDKSTGVDQRGQEVQGPQTNVAGDAAGPVLSGEFHDSVTIKDDQQRKEDNP